MPQQLVQNAANFLGMEIQGYFFLRARETSGPEPTFLLEDRTGTIVASLPTTMDDADQQRALACVPESFIAVKALVVEGERGPELLLSKMRPTDSSDAARLADADPQLTSKRRFARPGTEPLWIKDAEAAKGQLVEDYFCLWEMRAREKRGGGKYLLLTLADSSGTAEAKMWDRVEGVAELPAGTEVWARIKVGEYQGKADLCVQELRAVGAEDTGRYRPEQLRFRKLSTRPLAEMRAELLGIVDGFTNGHLQALLRAFLLDPEIGPAFFEAPAAKMLHHAWIGGLVEHVLGLVTLLRAMAPSYPEVNLELAITGAILHDIGKVRELNWDLAFRYELEGQLIGHISIAQGWLHEKLRELPGFPRHLRLLIEHMLLSHHGKLEFGSPKLPMTPEAILLSAVDDLEAKFAAMRREFEQARAAGRKADEPTEWVRSMERNLFDSTRWLAEQEKTERTPAQEQPGLFADEEAGTIVRAEVPHGHE